MTKAKLSTRLRRYSKAIAGFVMPGVVILIGAIADGSDGGSTITNNEWSTAIGAMLATGGIVYQVRNRKEPAPKN